MSDVECRMWNMERKKYTKRKEEKITTKAKALRDHSFGMIEMQLDDLIATASVRGEIIRGN